MAQMPPKDPANPQPGVIPIPGVSNSGPPASGGSGGGWKSWIPLAVGTALDVFSMHRNQRNADTAHQREVADLKAANLNPVLSAMGGRGAAIPDTPTLGENVQRGVSSALAVQLQKASLDVMSAQAENLRASAVQSRVSAFQSATTFPARQEQLRVAIDQARAQVLATTSGADRVQALAALDKARLTGELNLEEVEKALGAGSPLLLKLTELMKLINEAR